MTPARSRSTTMAMVVAMTLCGRAGARCTSTEFIVNLGGGVERAIRDNIRFRGDTRYFFGGDLVPDYWRLSTGLQFGVGRR